MKIKKLDSKNLASMMLNQKKGKDRKLIISEFETGNSKYLNYRVFIEDSDKQIPVEGFTLAEELIQEFMQTQIKVLDENDLSELKLFIDDRLRKFENGEIELKEEIVDNNYELSNKELFQLNKLDEDINILETDENYYVNKLKLILHLILKTVVKEYKMEDIFTKIIELNKDNLYNINSDVEVLEFLMSLEDTIKNLKEISKQAKNKLNIFIKKIDEKYISKNEIDLKEKLEFEMIEKDEDINKEMTHEEMLDELFSMHNML